MKIFIVANNIKHRLSGSKLFIQINPGLEISDFPVQILDLPLVHLLLGGPRQLLFGPAIQDNFSAFQQLFHLNVAVVVRIDLDRSLVVRLEIHDAGLVVELALALLVAY